MLKGALSRAAGSSGLERLVTENPILSKPAHRFIAGEGLEEAVGAAADLQALGISALLDLVGEGVTDEAGAKEATAEYIAALEAIAESGLDGEISVKLTQLGQSVDRAACRANLNEILSRADELGVPVEIDMEDHTLVSDTLEFFRDAVDRYPVTRLAMQAMLRRTLGDFHALADITPRVRLVKGAYDEPIEVAERDKQGVNAQYKLLTDWLMSHGGDPAFGTHDGTLIDYARERPLSERVRASGTSRSRCSRRPSRSPGTARPGGLPGTHLHPLRVGLVPVLRAAAGRAPREPGFLPACPRGPLSQTPRPEEQHARSHHQVSRPLTTSRRTTSRGRAGTGALQRDWPSYEQDGRASSMTIGGEPGSGVGCRSTWCNRTGRRPSSERCRTRRPWTSRRRSRRPGLLQRHGVPCRTTTERPSSSRRRAPGGPWRQTLNASTMLGQSKTAHQAEIDAACEMIDFFRFNVHFAEKIYAEQPISDRGVWNRPEYRPLEGFVYAITPFNFTSIGGNLPRRRRSWATRWCGSRRARRMLSELLHDEDVRGRRAAPRRHQLHHREPAKITEEVLASRDFGGIHFTGSTAVFNSFWRDIGANVGTTAPTPASWERRAARTSSWPIRPPIRRSCRTAMVRGSFEYQGQKCSAASRAYVPRASGRRSRTTSWRR